MSQEKSPARRKLESVERQEEKVWVEFYPEVRRDATLAVEILTELERDDPLRRRHRGLYLCCQRTIRLQESREARNRRVGRAVRRLFSAVFIAFPKWIRDGLQRGRSLAVECLPEMEDTPAEKQVKRLLENDAYVHAEKSFRERARKAADKSEAQQAPDAAEDAAATRNAARG
ncbi:MAG: hypothetical protein QM740_20275 [Acidovorax sp.]